MRCFGHTGELYSCHDLSRVDNNKVKINCKMGHRIHVGGLQLSESKHLYLQLYDSS